MAENTLKIVITYKEGKAMVGVSKPECDPKLNLLEGTLPEVLMQVPEKVDQAEAEWAENPKYPKCETDLTPPAPKTPAKSTASTGTGKKEQVKGAKEAAEKPRLF